MESTGKVIAAFLAGTAAGASLGFLLAPEKGEKTRNQLKEVLDEWGEKASEQFQKYKQSNENK